MVHENCGVVGAFSLSKENVVPVIIDCLRALQHRGQESWGFAVPSKLPFKRLGLVSSYANEFSELIKCYRSFSAIGHVRYSTAGKSILENAQPLKINDLCIAHNGTIANVEELSLMVGGCTFTPQTMSDTLIAAQRLVNHIEENKDVVKAMHILKKEMIGSFCFTFLTDDGTVYAARDTKGFRPLVLGKYEKTDTYIIASESCAFSAVGANLLRDINPGELIKINETGIDSRQFYRENNHAHCAFEYTYFAHPSSNMENKNVYEVRKRIGRLLAKKYPIYDADVVIPVPDSARPAALGYAEEMNIPFEEGLLKNRYSIKGAMRSFIEPFQENRIEINKSIFPIFEIIKDKHVVVIDDSIVRGTSSEAIIKTLRAAQTKRISMIITYPPIKYPCYAGIDFPSQEELIAYMQTGENSTLEEIGEKVAKLIGADFVGYNDINTLAAAIDLPQSELCFTCSSGDYSPLKIKPVFRTRSEMKGE